MRRRLLLLSLVLGSFAAALVAGELGVRIYEKLTGRRFTAFAELTSESFFYRHQGRDPITPLQRARFDPLLGWKAGPLLEPTRELTSINAQGWRSDHVYQPRKTRKRVAVVGDSFIFGLHLHDQDTITSQLERMLGPEYEVMNFGVEGWGLDQIALAALIVVPEYAPDHIVVAFIAHDLERTCRSFAWGSRAKPVFTLTADSVEPPTAPLPSPDENQRRHQESGRAARDIVATLLTRSHVLNVLAEPWMRMRDRVCMSTLNPRIIAYTHAQLSPKFRLSFVHLDAELPTEFRESMPVFSQARFLSLPARVPALAKELGVTPQRPDGLHPDAALARIYAKALRDEVLGFTGARAP